MRALSCHLRAQQKQADPSFSPLSILNKGRKFLQGDPLCSEQHPCGRTHLSPGFHNRTLLLWKIFLLYRGQTTHHLCDFDGTELACFISFAAKRASLGVGIGCEATALFASTRLIKFSESFLFSFGVALILSAKVYLLSV